MKEANEKLCSRCKKARKDNNDSKKYCTSKRECINGNLFSYEPTGILIPPQEWKHYQRKR